MPVLNFSYAKVKDVEKFKQYVEAAAPLLQEAGVEVVVRGNFSTTMQGDQCEPHVAAIFRYKDMESVEKFYTSEKYKPLIPLRDAACDMTIHLYEE